MNDHAPEMTATDAAEADQFAAERELLAEAESQGVGATLGAWVRLSGPGWLQSAITLGGGSLASSLILGILAGHSMMWLQPLAMIFGIIMLSAIGYVTLSSGERPFRSIVEHVNPVLGWGWVLSVAAANFVWCMPQFALAFGVVEQNLLPGVFGPEGVYSAALGGSLASKITVSLLLLALATLITWSYDAGGLGIQIFETVLKIMVAVIVICFFGVVITLSVQGKLDWGGIFAGFIPNPMQFFEPNERLAKVLAEISDVEARTWWSDYIVGKQQDVIISAAATAVGINMTFMFPYSMLRKGWTKEFRGLSIFDLGTGMFIPFILATGCVVIAASSQFHAQVTEDFEKSEAGYLQATKDSGLTGGFNDVLSARVQVVDAELAKEVHGQLKAETIEPQEGTAKLASRLSEPEQRLAAMMVNRKAIHLSRTLADFTGDFVANIVFGLGVFAMALSTIAMLMLISGFVFCEMFGLEPTGWPHRIFALLAGVVGVLGPFFWGQASFYLAVPTSVFGFVLLPFAYLTFIFLMNQPAVLKDEMPQGIGRWVWNILMGLAAGIATIGSIYMIWTKSGYYGIAAVSLVILAAVIVHFVRRPQAAN